MKELGSTLILASGNKGKLKEFGDLFATLNINVESQGAYHVPDADETGLSFIENAILKARHASKLTELPALADDSGLSVDFLKGAPGIYSARYSGEHGNDQANNEKLLKELEHVPDDQRGAKFICALALVRHWQDPLPIIAVGQWHGRITHEIKGEGGFGYDPLFWVPSHHCTSAELDKAEKNRISHRGIASQLLMDQLKDLAKGNP